MKNLIAITAIAILSGCALPPNSASVYSSSQAQGEQSVRLGIVDSIREVTIDKGESGIGTLAGAALGGLGASSGIGKGRGSLAAGIAGAVIGGVIGNQAESSLGKRRGLEITVRLRSGELTAITQDADELFRVGDQVRLLSSGGVTRVTH